MLHSGNVEMRDCYLVDSSLYTSDCLRKKVNKFRFNCYVWFPDGLAWVLS